MPVTDAGARYEVMPFASVEAQVAELPEPLRLTITTSPKHGVDHSLDFAERIHGAGHPLTLHVAARMVRGAAHLDEILARARELRDRRPVRDRRRRAGAVRAVRRRPASCST